jgi:hypothetical protein
MRLANAGRAAALFRAVAAVVDEATFRATDESIGLVLWYLHSIRCESNILNVVDDIPGLEKKESKKTTELEISTLFLLSFPYLF